jgi:CRP-like cAMP-binding protein
VEIFSSLEPESLAELARAGIETHFAPGDLLMQEGEYGDEAFIVLAGDVTVLHKTGDDAEVVIDQRSVGEVIGEMAVLDPAPRAATLRASANGVRVLRLDGASFREALKADPAVASGVIRALAQRVRRLVGMVG